MNPFERTVYVGNISSTRPRTKVDVTIRWDGSRLGITGTTWRNPNWDVDSAGQIVDQLPEVDQLAIPAADRDELVEVWNRWHLNDMRPDCEHQRALGWHERRIDPSKPSNVYGKHFEGQRHDSWNLLGWVRPDERPDGLMGVPCPECGYKYGTAWLHEDVPEDVLEFLASVGGNSVTERVGS